VFYPDVPMLREGTCLDVHSKVMIVDDEWLRIGSANLSNRSMGMDTECDLTLDAKGDVRWKRAIRAFCDGVIAEHVGWEIEAVARQIESAGTLSRAIAGMGSPTRKLVKLDAPEPTETTLVIAEVGDPGEPIFETIVAREAPLSAAQRFPVRRALYVVGGLIVVATALTLVWTHTPLNEYVTRENAAALGEFFAEHWWAPLVAILAYTPASFIMFPRWIITMTAVLAFGPGKGFVYAMTGVLIAGMASFIPGSFVGRDTVRRVAGKRLRPVTKFMRQRGLIAVTLVRLVPIAPFPVVNLVMSAMRVKLWHFVLGTFIGMLPGMLATTVLSEQLAAMLEEPRRVNFWISAATILALVTLAFFSQRYMRRNVAH